MGKKESFYSFESLACWQRAFELKRAAKALVRQFPKSEQYDLVPQARKAARSVTANIAEGFGRFHYLDNAKFCRNARGSLYELLDHFIEAEDEGYIQSDQLQLIRNEIFDVLRVLNGYIHYLVKRHYEKILPPKWKNHPLSIVINYSMTNGLSAIYQNQTNP